MFGSDYSIKRCVNLETIKTSSTSQVQKKYTHGKYNNYMLDVIQYIEDHLNLDREIFNCELVSHMLDQASHNIAKQ